MDYQRGRQPFMIVEQDLPCRVSGRYLTGDEPVLIRGIIAENPATSRA
jgi:hypothetical protein